MGQGFEEIRDQPIELRRLLQVHGMPGVGHDGEARVRQRRGHGAPDGAELVVQCANDQ